LKMRIPLLELPLFLRKVLKTPLSKLLVSQNTITGLRVDYAVGDIVSLNHEAVYRIFDGKTHRQVLRAIQASSYVINPPGAIALNALTLLKCSKYRDFPVDGEEDLLTLAVSRETRDKILIYGQPHAGVVVLRTNPYWALNIIKVFKPIIAEYGD